MAQSQVDLVRVAGVEQFVLSFFLLPSVPVPLVDLGD